MALVTTAGAADADSYASVEDADEYHVGRGNSTWAAATEEEKEAALRRATSWIDATYVCRWPGEPLNGRGQSLDWPRADALDIDGNLIDPTTIPPEVEFAAMEGALIEMTSPGSLTQAVSQVYGGPIIKEVVGPVERAYASPGKSEYSYGSTSRVPQVENYLTPLLISDLPFPVVIYA